MTIAVEATEAKATALITECRRCLAIGVDLKGQFIKDVRDGCADLPAVLISEVARREDVHRCIKDFLGSGR